MNYVIEIFKYLEESGLLHKGVTGKNRKCSKRAKRRISVYISSYIRCYFIGKYDRLTYSEQMRSERSM